MGKQKAGAVLTIISYILLIAVVVCFALYFTKFQNSEILLDAIVALVLVSVIAGTIANILIARSDEQIKGFYLAMYVLSILPSLPAFIILLIWIALRYLWRVIDLAFGNKTEVKKYTVYTILDMGFERKLTVENSYKIDYKAKGLPSYVLLVDDLGRHWRSYDKCKTFLPDSD